MPDSLTARYARYGSQNWILLGTPFRIARMDGRWQVLYYRPSHTQTHVISGHARDYLERHGLDVLTFATRDEAAQAVLAHLRIFPASWPPVPLPQLTRTAPGRWTAAGTDVRRVSDPKRFFAYRVDGVTVAASLTEARHIRGLQIIDDHMAGTA